MHQLEPHLITAVTFSVEDPYGRAVALLDLKSGTVKVQETCVYYLECILYLSIFTVFFFYGVLGQRRMVPFAWLHTYVYTR